MSKICIAVDAMSGDVGPAVTVPAALQVLAEFPELHLILVGQSTVIEDKVTSQSLTEACRARLTIQAASQVVEMDEPPAQALRSKKDSSMRVAINLVHEQRAQATVSAGNTGALMATARFVLKMLPGIDRPAILFPLPTQKDVVHMLDLGANIDCQSEHLLQFAVMGSVLVESVYQTKSKPRVGLLNVGVEAIKGTDAVKQAAQALEAMPFINYIGFIEGNDIYQGDIDVVVCDGFVGNVALKASEGLAKMMLQCAKEEFSRNWFTQSMAWASKPILKRLFNRFDPNRYNGGSLLGLQGVVIKSHGGATSTAFAMAIRRAVDEVRTNVTEKIKIKVSETLKDIEGA